MKKIKVICMILVMSMLFCSCGLPMKNLVREMIEDEEDVVRYQDDFYDNVTQEVLSQIELQPTDAQWTWFGELSAIANDDMEEIIHEILESDEDYEKGSMEQKIKDLYECIMEVYEYNTIEYGSIEPYLHNIENANTIDDYVDAIVKFSGDKAFCSIIGGYYVDQDMADSNIYATYLMGPDTLVGKEYLENEATEDYCDIFFNYMIDSFEVYGMSRQEAVAAEEKVEQILRTICDSTLSTQQYYDPALTYNVLTPEELQEIYTNVDIDNMLTALRLDKVDTFILKDVEQAKTINSLLVEENLEALKLYSIFVCLNDTGSYTSAQLRELQDKCYNDMHGITESKSHEDQAIDEVKKMLSWEFAKIYAEKYFSEANKENVEAMIEEIIDSYESIISRQEWMSEETKQKAVRKLETMVVKIGYPDEWPEICDQLQIQPLEEGGTYLSNLLDLTAISQQEDLDKIGKEVDRTEWGMTPQTVNAYYNVANNEIVFPAAILQPPFFDGDRDYASNLGGIGYIIAHEISHAFDSSGALYDEYGNYNIWWTEEEFAKYKSLSQEIIEYYNQYEFMGKHIDGELTLSENIADLGAMTCITNILGNDVDDLDKMFTQLAYNWACDETVEYGMYLLANDVHAPNKIRVNAVFSACDAFYQAYDIKSTDKMYVAPEMRVGIWK